MNTLQKGFSFVLVAFAVVAMTVVLTPKAHADDFSGDCCGGGGFDSSFNGGYDNSYDAGFDSSYNSGYDSTYTPGYDSSYTPGYDSTYTPGYDSTYAPGYDSTYTPGYDSSYAPGYDNSYSPTYYGSDGAMYSTTGGSSGGGYSTGGGYPFSFGTYNIGRPTSISQPTHTTTVSTPSSQYQTQSQTSTNVNNNSSNSVSSVSNSGNSNNVNNVNVIVNAGQQQAPITPVYTLPTVQYPVQFVPLQQPVYQPAPYCTISIVNTNGYNNNYGYNQATLTWSASNATSAYISPSVGTVSTYGTRVVNPGSNQIYTMTVYGQNGQTANCQTTFYAQAYVPPAQPYVSLSQIPYTGFDLGPIGDAAYWAAMISFALAAGYLMIYFRGGALALAGSTFGSRGYASEESTEEEVISPIQVVPAEEQTTTGMDFNLPVTSSRHVTTDSMNITSDGRLVITRN